MELNAHVGRDHVVVWDEVREVHDVEHGAHGGVHEVHDVAHVGHDEVHGEAKHVDPDDEHLE